MAKVSISRSLNEEKVIVLCLIKLDIKSIKVEPVAGVTDKLPAYITVEKKM